MHHSRGSMFCSRAAPRASTAVLTLALALVSSSTFAGIAGCGAATQKPHQKSPTPIPLVNPAVPVHQRGGRKLIVEMGRTGGTLELDSGARLEIPEGALAETVQVTFASAARTTAFSNHDYERPLGPTLEITPGLTLATPARVSVPAGNLPEGFTDSDLTLGVEAATSEQRAVQGQGTRTRWDYVPATAQGGRAVAELATVPGYRLQFVVSRGE